MGQYLTKDFYVEVSPWPATAERSLLRVAKQKAVVDVAARLFVEHGYQRTTLSMIAAELNITKAALYTYFANKEAILVEAHRLGDQMVSEQINEILAGPENGLGKIKQFVRGYSAIITTTFGKCLRIDDRELSHEASQEVRRHKRSIDMLVRQLVAAGVEDGSIAPCDVRTTAFLVMGAMNWIGFWFNPAKSDTPSDIADRCVQFLTYGLLGQPAEDNGQDPSTASNRRSNLVSRNPGSPSQRSFSTTMSRMR